jgi:hypothetical protein
MVQSRRVKGDYGARDYRMRNYCEVPLKWGSILQSRGVLGIIPLQSN